MLVHSLKDGKGRDLVAAGVCPNSPRRRFNHLTHSTRSRLPPASERLASLPPITKTHPLPHAPLSTNLISTGSCASGCVCHIHRACHGLGCGLDAAAGSFGMAPACLGIHNVETCGIRTWRRRVQLDLSALFQRSFGATGDTSVCLGLLDVYAAAPPGALYDPLVGCGRIPPVGGRPVKNLPALPTKRPKPPGDGTDTRLTAILQRNRYDEKKIKSRRFRWLFLVVCEDA